MRNSRNLLWIGLALIGILAMTTAATVWIVPAVYRKRAEPYLAAFSAAEAKYGLPNGLLNRMAYQESRYNKDARSSKGAVGLMQFMPATAADFGIDPKDPFQSIDAAGRYMNRLYARFKDWKQAIAAYNAGPGNVAKYGGIPPFEETRLYVAGIAKDIGLT